MTGDISQIFGYEKIEMKVDTRETHQADYEWLYRLKVAAMGDYIEAVYGWDEDLQRRLFKDDFRPQEIEIITVDGSDAGMFLVTRESEGYVLQRLEILPQFQGRGVGSTILRKIMETALDEAVPVRLQVFKSNPARSLYERLGFRVIEETRTHYRMALDVIRSQNGGASDQQNAEG